MQNAEVKKLQGAKSRQTFPKSQDDPPNASVVPSQLAETTKIFTVVKAVQLDLAGKCWKSWDLFFVAQRCSDKAYQWGMGKVIVLPAPGRDGGSEVSGR